MNPFEYTKDKPPITDLVAYAKWLESVGRSRTTGWRWRQKGWINIINIAGRPYVRREDIEVFMARAAAGEFSDTKEVADTSN